MSDISTRRDQYETRGLEVGDLADEPMEQWQRWYAQAVDAGCVEPNAFVLGTVDLDGGPDARYVLARSADEHGFAFHTNYESTKSRQLLAEPRASAVFGWLQLHRQVRVIGTVELLDVADSDAYFASRPRESQIGAWASPQSTPLPDRAALERQVADIAASFAAVEHIPRPAFWGGWLLRPSRFEFWQGRRNRLHDRLAYRRPDGDDDLADHPTGGWLIERLAP